MESKITQLPGSKVELKFTVTVNEVQPYLDKVVEEIGQNRPIPGFRPGKAPYDEIKKVVGEMEIWQYALEKIVRTFYVKAVLDNQLDTVGSPEIAVDQLVPGQEMKFTCTASVMPKVQKLEEIEKPFVEIKIKEVKDEDVDHAIDDLRKMRRQEVITDQPATKDHMASIDLEMKNEGVVLEGGSTHDYRVYLSEDHYIPKFAEQLVGLKKGDKKSFKLPFPEDHYQKVYAGKDIDFEVTIKEIYEIKLPEVNDEFAKGLGVETADKFKDLIRKNLQSENERRAMEIAEIELLETLVKKSTFTEVPENLAKEETNRMYNELQNDIESHNGHMQDYLASIKKTADQLRLDMVPTAMARVQTSVLVREVAKRNSLEVSSEEIDNEIDRLISIAPDKETRDRVSSPEYREYVATVMRNRKTLEFLKEKGIKGYKELMDKFAKEEEEAHKGHVHGPDCDHDHE